MWWIADLIEPVREFDLFPIIDFEQKLKWYFHYSSMYIESIIKTFIIIYLCKKLYYDKKTRLLLNIFLAFAVFRLLEYWLFRFQIPVLSMVLILMVVTVKIYKTHG